MFKKTDPNPQLDLFTAPVMQLGSRASKKYSDPQAWHNQFYSLVTTKIDEEIFKPLFPEGKKSGRPNASIRVLVGMSILKVTPFFLNLSICLYTKNLEKFIQRYEKNLNLQRISTKKMYQGRKEL